MTIGSFNGRKILVTGAAGGIGGAIVRHLIEAGAHVLAADHPDSEIAARAQVLGAEPLAFDITDEDAVAAALRKRDLYGTVNCAGWGGLVQPTVDADLDIFERVMRINTRGTLLVTKYAAREMIRVGNGGAIVNVSSQASLVALDGHASYAASKAAIDGLTRVAALELGRHSIRVNAVNPTVVMTEMSASYWGQPEIEQPFLTSMPLGRWATEDDIAGPVTFLLSDRAAMITGVTLPVDGGYTAQ